MLPRAAVKHQKLLFKTFFNNKKGVLIKINNFIKINIVVSIDHEFRMCEYLKTNLGDYVLKDERCQLTPFVIWLKFTKKILDFALRQIYQM